VRLARLATASETQRGKTESFPPSSEKQRRLSLSDDNSRSATTQEQASSLQLAARLA
ncbi:hypothetical protein A2U01_0059009, partial [Trifolium medium]|nr:hypothetical protein [Trifolium medium]